MRWIKARFAGAQRDAGLTLVELLVAAAMGAILMGAVASMVISAMRAQPEVSERSQNISTARWVLERLTREVRNGVSVDPEHAKSSEVSFLAYVRHTVCGGTTPRPSDLAAIPCQVTYKCTTTSCVRIEAAQGVFTGIERTIFSGIDSSNVFSYRPNATEPTYIKMTLHIPNPSGPAGLTVSDGASLRNATLEN